MLVRKEEGYEKRILLLALIIIATVFGQSMKTPPARNPR
jgi:hypothetical protein